MNEPVTNPLNLYGRRILVTGASSGIGQATAILLSQLGAQVVLAGRVLQKLEATYALLNGPDHQISVYDLQNLTGIPTWVEKIVDDAGPLHGFVHAAGIQYTAPLRSLTTEKWREIFLLNTEVPLVLSKSFSERKIHAEKNCSIVFISSVMGMVGAPGRVAYSLSKGALDGMTKSLALELAPKRIRVNGIAPALVRTAMLEEMAKVWTSDQWLLTEKMHPLGLGMPEDVANAAAFLLAETGKWITGTILVIDGGYTAQ